MKKFLTLIFVLASMGITSGQTQLIDIFYEALGKSEEEIAGTSKTYAQLYLSDIEEEIIDPQAIIRKYPDAAKFLVDDSIFVINCVFNLNGLIKDVSEIGDPGIYIRNFHFTNDVWLNLKLFSDVPDEIFYGSDFHLQNVRADQEVNIWYSNMNMIFEDVHFFNLNIYDESVVPPSFFIHDSEIAVMSIEDATIKYFVMEDNIFGWVIIDNVNCNEMEVINNIFTVEGLDGSSDSSRWNPMLTTLSRSRIAENLHAINHSFDLRSKGPMIFDLEMRGNYFMPAPGPFSVSMSQQAVIMDIVENQFEAPLIITSRVESDFRLTDNDFSTISLGAAMPETPQNHVNVAWKDLKGRMVWHEAGEDIYRAEGNEELAETQKFFSLLGTYSRLLEVYKNYGNLDDANDVYIDMKELHLRRYAFLFRTEGGTTNFFKLNLNRLLKYYTRHGTDPAQAMTASLWIILFFAIIYFFFPSEWDIASKRSLVRNFNEFVQKNEKGYFFPFLTLLRGLTISFFNAITLSINSFVTLGFGTIPTRGLAKYLCIFQGFLGWFLLSIFIVALINQILF